MLQHVDRARPNSSCKLSSSQLVSRSDQSSHMRRGCALFDGDPFEYTTHCVGTVIDGVSYPSVR